MNRLLLWLDNPIFVKHCRSRLRIMQLLPAVAVVMVLSTVILVVGYQFTKMTGGRLAGGGETFGALMMLQSVILGVMGASQVASSVGKASESGILDFHRVTPMTRFSMALGFFFGAPVREYLMFAATLPFSIACLALFNKPSPIGAIQLLVPLVLGAWVLHSIALFNALAGKAGKSGSGARGVIGMVVFLIFGGVWFIQGFFKAAQAVDDSPTGTIFTVELPWLIILAVDLFPVIGFFLTAATRKLGSERAHSLSKPQAIGALSTMAVLILGGLWGTELSFPWTLLVLYVLMLGAIILTSTITPRLDEFSKGIRKAAKEGRKYPLAWSDRGLNRISLFGFCGIVLVASTVCSKYIEPANSLGFGQVQAMSYSLPIAIGVLVVAYNGLALQFFLLRFGKRGATLYALFIFSAWLLPLICGMTAQFIARNNNPSGSDDNWPEAIASLSPIAGITTSSGLGRDMSGLYGVRACALVPSLVFALLFNNLVTSVRRRIEKQIHPEPTHETKPEPDILAEPVMMG